MSRYTEEEEDIKTSEPIMAQKGVRLGLSFVEKAEWEIKDKPEWSQDQKVTMAKYVGQKFDACKLTLTISDDTVRTERADAKPKLVIEDQFNIERFPYPNKKTGNLEFMGKQKLYQLEQAFGFEPVFTVDGQPVQPFVTKAGNKVAPKIEGKEVKRKINPDFMDTYFDANGNPIMANWDGKIIYADVEVEKSERYGDKNIIKNYVKGPVI